MDSKFDGNDPEIDEQYKDNPDQTRREFIKKLAYVAPVVTTILITHDLSLPDSAHGQATQEHPCRRQSPCRVYQPCRRQCCAQSIQPCRRQPCRIQPVCIRQC
ncbi:MAG: hypothetical protein J7K02_08225 [Deltaproteobacteria bacterium]|nr:hypothetical protein [Deltaproteobacteria bacterium]